MRQRFTPAIVVWLAIVLVAVGVVGGFYYGRRTRKSREREAALAFVAAVRGGQRASQCAAAPQSTPRETLLGSRHAERGAKWTEKLLSDLSVLLAFFRLGVVTLQ
jgi:hypothetical protein